MSEPDGGTTKVADGAGPRMSRLNNPRPVVRVLAWALAALLLAGLGTAGVLSWQSMNRVRAAQEAVAEASALLDAAEDDLLTVDEAVQVEISSTVTTQAVEAIELAGDVHADALAASSLIADALKDLPEEQRPLSTAIKDSADARAEMMVEAPIILEADRKAAAAIALADQAVAEIKSAEDLSAAAVTEFNRHTPDGVRASSDYSVQAEARLNAAQSLLTSATASFPGADFAPFGSYIEAKIGLIALAKEIDAAWLAGDIAGSNTRLETYNQRDAEIVAMAQALPASVRDPIANAYNAETAEVSERYFRARERARSAGERVSALRKSADASD